MMRLLKFARCLANLTNRNKDCDL